LSISLLTPAAAAKAKQRGCMTTTAAQCDPSKARVAFGKANLNNGPKARSVNKNAMAAEEEGKSDRPKQQRNMELLQRQERKKERKKEREREGRKSAGWKGRRGDDDKPKWLEEGREEKEK
jgi:hypothetical protein